MTDREKAPSKERTMEQNRPSGPFKGRKTKLSSGIRDSSGIDSGED